MPAITADRLTSVLAATEIGQVYILKAKDSAIVSNCGSTKAAAQFFVAVPALMAWANVSITYYLHLSSFLRIGISLCVMQPIDCPARSP